MAYFLTKNILDSGTVRLSGNDFTAGSQQEDFPFSAAFDGNPSTGFKSGSATAPTIIINFPSGQDFNAIGVFSPRTTATTILVAHSTTADISSATDSNWVETPMNRAGNNTGVSKVGMNISSLRSADVAITTTDLTGIRSLKFTFTNLDPQTDVITHMQVGQAVEVGISQPYNPPTFTTFQSTMKRNNKGNPLISDKLKAPSKVAFNITDLTEAEMKSLISDLGDLYVPFMVTTSYDLTSEIKGRAYYCILDRDLDQPRYVKPRSMSWRIKVLGHQ